MATKPLTLILATSNEGKVNEIREALSGLELSLLSAAEAGIGRLPDETGASYEENALLKAGYVAIRSGLPALGDDSGLEVDALSGAPGLHSARYGGPGLSDGERVAYLLDQLSAVPAKARGAGFVCTVVLTTPGGEMRSFKGECRGTIIDGPRGAAGFGYDPVFLSDELGRTFAEATLQEKRRVSHRGRALEAFLHWAMTPFGKRTMRTDHGRRR